MDFFSKTFFRFAFGFIGIIMLSVMTIFAVSAYRSEDIASDCLTGCAEQ